MKRTLQYVNFTWGMDEDEADLLIDDAYSDRVRPAREAIGAWGADVFEDADYVEARKAIRRLTARAADPIALDAVSCLTHSLLRYLYEEACGWGAEADGEKGALLCAPVVFLAAAAAYVIESLGLVPEAALKRVMPTWEKWPSLVQQQDLVKGSGKSPTLRQRLEDLGLGSCIKTKSRSSSPPSVYAQNMLHTIEVNRERLASAATDPLCDKLPKWVRECLTLPPLGSTSWRAWFEVGWSALLEATRCHPERLPELRILGQYRAKRYVPSSQRSSKVSQSQEANIRDGIKRSLMQAFKSLLND